MSFNSQDGDLMHIQGCWPYTEAGRSIMIQVGRHIIGAQMWLWEHMEIFF